MPQEVFHQNWQAYWNGVVQAQNREDKQALQRQIEKIGLELIEHQAKQNNNKPLVIAANALGVLHADNLAEAISKVLTIISESR